MDKFNDIWKNRFNQDDMSPGDWNMPDDEVWGNIMSEVPVKNDRRKWLFLFLGFILLGILIFSYFSFSKTSKNTYSDLDSLNGNVENTKLLTHFEEPKTRTIEPQPNENNTNTTDRLNVEKSKNTLLTALNIEKKIDPILSSTSDEFYAQTKSNSFNQRSKIKNNISPNESEGVGSLQATSLGDPVVYSVDKKDDLNLNRKELDVSRFLNDLSLLPMSVFKIDIKKEDHPVDTKIKFLDFNKKTKLIFGAEVGAVLWQHKISDQYQSDLTPFDFNYSDNVGWYSSLNVEVPINRFVTAFGGLQYEQIETNSGHNSALVYNVNAENNHGSNDYDLSLATPYGLSEASFRFDRNQIIADDEVDLLVDFNSRHRIQNLSIPIGIKVFPIGQQKRIVPMLSVGMGTNYLLNISNDIHSIDTHHDAIEYRRDGTSSFESPDLNQLYFDLRLGLGFGYNITRDIQANINANWSKGLNPIFEQDNYKTSINRYHLSLGLNYKLR